MNVTPNGLKERLKDYLRNRGWVAPEDADSFQRCWDMRSGLKRLRAIGIAPRTVVDLGAGEGKWTEIARDVFADAEFLLCEPLADRTESLVRLAASSDRIHFAPVVVGNREEPLLFDVAGDLDGSGVYGGDSGDAIELPQNTLDNLSDKPRFKPPFLIKFDTHGFESPILDGATKTLTMTDAIIMECYVHRISPTAKLFWEMCVELETLGFRPIHLSDLMARQFDSTLWQMDLFFVRSDHPVFTHARYA